MAVNTNKSCDNCATVVYGTDRGQFVQKDNIFINGQVGRNRVDPESGWRDTIYMTRTAQDQLAFCDLQCLHEWCEQQVELWDNRKKAKLREEAEMGITGQERISSGPKPSWSSEDAPQASRPYKKYGTPPANAPAPAPAPRPKRIGYGGEVTEG